MSFSSSSSESDKDFEYTVSWIDNEAKGDKLGRGIFIRGNTNESQYRSPLASGRKPLFTVPVDLPFSLLNRATITAFNTGFYWALHPKRISRKVVSYDPFFYPLDIIGRWNRFYGKGGLLQYQCVVPYGTDAFVMRQILNKIADHGEGFLPVLKNFGDIKSPGMLSFPRPGLTIALDFPYSGEKTLRLLDQLDMLVREHGGAVYPAKDARMSAESFQQYYPNWQEFAKYIDPKFSSSFWRRVTTPLKEA